MSRRRNKKYSTELKLEAVQDYLNGKGSLWKICEKYGIKDEKSLREWIMWYNGDKKFKERRGARTEIYMTKGRKTTLEERIEIVEYCIEHGKDYPATIEKYSISYQQIYSWVRKYEGSGVDGLRDGRGRTKPYEEMTDVEKLQAENRLLKAQLRDKEVEMLLLKKLQELERGGR
ncbi:MAG: transposase [Hominimerdicola sp.]